MYRLYCLAGKGGEGQKKVFPHYLFPMPSSSSHIEGGCHRTRYTWGAGRQRQSERGRGRGRFKGEEKAEGEEERERQRETETREGDSDTERMERMPEENGAEVERKKPPLV